MAIADIAKGYAAVLGHVNPAFALTTLGVRKKLILYFKGEAELFTKLMVFKPR